MSKAGNLIDLARGVVALQRGTGIDKATISRWNSDGTRSTGGIVPPQYNPAIQKWAKKAVVPDGYTRQTFIAAVEACLEPYACPCCGRPIDGGTVLNPKAVKRARR